MMPGPVTADPSALPQSPTKPSPASGRSVTTRARPSCSQPIKAKRAGRTRVEAEPTQPVVEPTSQGAERLLGESGTVELGTESVKLVVSPLVRNSLDTLISAIEMDLGAAGDARSVPPDRPPIPKMRINLADVTRSSSVTDDVTRTNNDVTRGTEDALRTDGVGKKGECTSSCSSSCSGSETCSCSESEDEGPPTGDEAPPTEDETPPSGSQIRPSPMQLQSSDQNKGKFICHICSRTFLWNDAYKTHLATHTREKPHVCTICDKSFSQAASLAEHMVEHTTNQEPQLGQHTDRTVTAGKPRNPRSVRTRPQTRLQPDPDSSSEKTQSGDELSPSKRPRRTRKPSAKVRAIAEDQPQPAQRLYKCQHCGMLFDQKPALIRHLKKHTEEPLGVDNAKLSSAIPKLSINLTKPNPQVPAGERIKDSLSLYGWKRNPNNKRKFECPYCKKLFKFKCALNRHIRTHTAERPYECKKCDSKFRSGHQLVQHQAAHTDEKPFVCHLCNSGFKTANQLKTHHIMHTGERPYVCQLCNATFPRNHTLKKHMRTHTKEKPYKCHICAESFTYSDRLKEHLINHDPSKQNRLECETCGKKFTHHRNLKVHEKIRLGIKNYKCELCPKTFIQASGRSRHMKSHTGDKPHLCETCGIRFGYPSEVADHVKRIHQGEKRQKCELCGKTFQTTRDLQRHHRTHTGEKPYACSVCNKSFSQAYTLKIHMRTHTGEKTEPKKKSEPVQETAAPMVVTIVTKSERDPNFNSSTKPERIENQDKFSSLRGMLQSTANEYSQQYSSEKSQQQYPAEKRRNYVELLYEIPPQPSPMQYCNTTRYQGSGFETEGKLPPVSELSRLPPELPSTYEPLQTPYKSQADEFDEYGGGFPRLEYGSRYPARYAEAYAEYERQTGTPYHEYERDYPAAAAQYDTDAVYPRSDVVYTTEGITVSASLAYTTTSSYGHTLSRYVNTPVSYSQQSYNAQTAAQYDVIAKQERYDVIAEQDRFGSPETSFQPGTPTGEPESQPVPPPGTPYSAQYQEEYKPGENEDQYKCEGCGETFVTSSDLLDHLKAHIDAELAGIEKTDAVT